MAKKKSPAPPPPSRAPRPGARRATRSRRSARRAATTRPRSRRARSPPKKAPRRPPDVEPPKTSPPSRTSSRSSRGELAKRLEQAQTALGHTRQEDARPRGLAKLARQLATPEISEHRSTSVRLWAATCVCEVLRIFAPNAPYGDGELLAAFRLLGAALKAAGAASNGETAISPEASETCYRVATTVPKCVRLDGALRFRRGRKSKRFIRFLRFATKDRLGRDVVRTTGRHIRRHERCRGATRRHPRRFRGTTISLITPVGPKAAPTTHWLAQAVVRRGADALTRPVAAWLNGCLSLSPTEGIVTPENEKKKKRRRRSDDSSSSSEEDEETPLKRIGQDTLAKSDASGANAYALVFEVVIHAIDAMPLERLSQQASLKHTGPPRGAESLRKRLLAEDDRTREATLTLLGRLFASPKEDYASSYPGHLPGVVEEVPRQV